MLSEIRETRLKNKFTQEEAAKFLGISLRSYVMYENNDDKRNSIKYEYILNKLKDNCEINENKGLLTLEEIEKTVKNVFKDYKIEYCYLFGSYAKKMANEKSDVDLLISTDLNGLKFYGLVEKLRQELHKNVDLLNVDQLSNNPELINEILKYGFKIYG